VLTHAEKTDPRVTKSMMQIPLGAWDTYRIRYPWQPVFEGMATPERIERIRYFNGERDYLSLPMNEQDKSAARPVPSYVMFIMRKGREPGMMYEIDLEEEETLETFRKLSAEGKDLKLVFHTELVDGKPKFTLLVRNESRAVRLTKIKRHYFRVD
jgi:hypothetical protein